MRILIAHNFYQQPGGEDSVFYAECALLEKHGHTPLRYVMHNNQLKSMTYLSIAGKTIWNKQVHRELRELVRGHSIDVVHFHNTFPLISPAAYNAVRREGAAVVQTLHNYRLLCPNAVLFRDGNACEECLTRKLKLPAIRHSCYRDSLPPSGVLTASLAYHHWRGTYHKDVDLFISPSEAARQIFVKSGMSADQIAVKPHFVAPDPGPGPGGNYAIFVGRLSQEKGVETLLAAWEKFNGRIPLKVIGDGPMREKLLEAIEKDHSIEWLGRRPLREIYELLGHAGLLVVPSHTRETFGRVAIEAFACGTPVIAANHGALADIVTEKTGMLVAPGSADELAAGIEKLAADAQGLREMRAHCRARFQALYTGEQNYPQLIGIYQRAIKLAQNRRAEELGLEMQDNDVPLPHNQLG